MAIPPRRSSKMLTGLCCLGQCHALKVRSTQLFFGLEPRVLHCAVTHNLTVHVPLRLSFHAGAQRRELLDINGRIYQEQVLLPDSATPVSPSKHVSCKLLVAG